MKTQPPVHKCISPGLESDNCPTGCRDVTDCIRCLARQVIQHKGRARRWKGLAFKAYDKVLGKTKGKV